MNNLDYTKFNALQSLVNYSNFYLNNCNCNYNTLANSSYIDNCNYNYSMLDKNYYNNSNINSKNNENNIPSSIKTDEKKIKEYFDFLINIINTKDFLYREELKKIEEKYNFNFDFCYKDEEKSIFIKVFNFIVKQIFSKIKEDKIETYNITDIDFYPHLNRIRYEYISYSKDNLFIHNSFHIELNNNHFFNLFMKNVNKNKEEIIKKINSKILLENEYFLTFIDKFKYRIVNDNNYEDNSFYIKILEE